MLGKYDPAISARMKEAVPHFRKKVVSATGHDDIERIASAIEDAVVYGPLTGNDKSIREAKVHMKQVSVRVA